MTVNDASKQIQKPKSSSKLAETHKRLIRKDEKLDDDFMSIKDGTQENSVENTVNEDTIVDDVVVDG